MNYQEKCSTRADVRALYEKVCHMPHVRRYRGYTAEHSYGWNPISQDYIKRSGEYWFDNDYYDPECEIPEENLEAEETVVITNKVELTNADDIGPADLATEIPRILDSGNRRQFETGAVRDICEGKGRCDLLPLDVVGGYYDYIRSDVNHYQCSAEIFRYLGRFQQTGDYLNLYKALDFYNAFPDLDTEILEVAKHFEEGCKKYGDNNWQKGIPTHCYIDSAVRHYLKYLRGDKDEPHDRAFCWNIMCCIWTCIHKPELNDYAPKEETDE